MTSTAVVSLSVTIGFSKASLNGQYAFSLKDPVGGFSLVGTLAADGNGGITQGTLDVNDDILYSSQIASVATDVAFTGGYQITADGRGDLNLCFPAHLDSA